MLSQKRDICDPDSLPRENTRNTPNLLILCSERVKHKVMFYIKFVPSWKKRVSDELKKRIKVKGKVYKYHPERMREFSDLFQDSWDDYSTFCIASATKSLLIV